MATASVALAQLVECWSRDPVILNIYIYKSYFNRGFFITEINSRFTVPKEKRIATVACT